MRKLFVLTVTAILSAACGGSSSDNNQNVTPTAATPTFSVPAGAKNAPISVTISSATAGAVIHYTTNGVDPTAASTTTQPVVLSTATTLKAIATASGYNASAVATAAYTFQAATPTFSVAAGTYLSGQSVGLATVTPGATIYYTTDGSTPTTSSSVYSTAIDLSTDHTTTTIKAIAVFAGFTNSAVASATYEINSTATPTATPTFSPVAGTYGAAQDVTISCTDAGAAIYYTTDGSTPTTGSTAYSAPVHVASNLTVKAIAIATGHTPSAVGSADYTINLPAAATPTFSPVAGSYNSAQNVTISTTTSGATIYYTTDGSTPTVSSTVYSAPVAVATSRTLKAIATAPDHTTSAVGTATYTITPPAATPTFSPAGGSYASAQNVTISTTTPSATIYYTTDGSTPTVSSSVYSTPVAVSTSKTLKAIATASGYSASAVGSATYTIGGGATCGSGTDFATVCACIMQKLTDLMTTCEKFNPDLVAVMMTGCGGMQKEIDAGLITYNASAGAACKADTLAMTCADLVSGGGANPAPSCDTAVAGTVPNGTGLSNHCYSSDDCANGYCTSETTLACPGYCQPFATAGQDCSSAECAAGLGCDYSGPNPVCVTLHAAGGACPCQDGLFCDDTSICRAPKTSGSCAVYNDGECAVGYGCFAPTPPTGTCVTLAGAGESCTAHPCGLGYYCASGTCTSAKAAGASCGTAGFTGSTSECLSFYCSAGVCTAVSTDSSCSMP